MAVVNLKDLSRDSLSGKVFFCAVCHMLYRVVYFMSYAA